MKKRPQISISLAVLFVIISFFIGLIAAYIVDRGNPVVNPTSSGQYITAPDGTQIKQPTTPPSLEQGTSPREQSVGPTYPPPSK